MIFKYCLCLFLSLIISLSNFILPANAAINDESDLQEQLGKLEKTIEDSRKELKVPGLGIAIVKDDKIIYMKGFGLRNTERNLPVTPDTLFAIGSTTKAFTSMSIAMSVDESKLSFDDSPKKFLPYFKLQDPEADSKITIRDLLCHKSGLNRTELSWYTGVLSREEVIKAAAFAKPAAKLREKFLYQNVMYSAAGEAMAKAQNMPYEQVISERIFKPLGMKVSNFSLKETQKVEDHSTGYTIDQVSKEIKSVPMRDLTNIAPAGAINSSVKDMAQWIRLMLGRGIFEGKRLVSEKNFNELVSKQITIAENNYYGLGWGITTRKDHSMWSHDGGIDGFNARVTIFPDHKIGYVILTNVTSSPILDIASKAIYSTLINKKEGTKDNPTTSSIDDLQKEVGTYRITEVGIDIEVSLKDGKLIAVTPNEPAYTLKNIEGRKYEAIGPTPEPTNIFVTFRPVKGKEDETEAYLEMPMGNFVLTRIKPAKASPTSTNNPDKYKELLGQYEISSDKPRMEITIKDGKTVLVVPGQPPYEMVEKEKDNFSFSNLPPSFNLMVKRDKDGKVAGILMKQPQGDFEFKRLAEFAPSITIEELMTKVINAAGGEANIRQHKSFVGTYVSNYEHQGVKGEGAFFAKAPNYFSFNETLLALDKKIGSISEYFDGTKGSMVMSFTPVEVYNEKLLQMVKARSDFYQLLNWKTLYKTVAIKGITKIGDEEAYIVVKTPENGDPITDYISTKSWLILARDSMLPISSLPISLPIKEIYSDYRQVGGMMVSFKTVTVHPTLGDVVRTVKELKLDAEISDDQFRIPK
jgi:CubicO group peptidase (beta-lactamase class C family)